jgi:hypothetical protein
MQKQFAKDLLKATPLSAVSHKDQQHFMDGGKRWQGFAKARQNEITLT